MEKTTPHYDLVTAQALVAAQGVNAFTMMALSGIATMGLTQADAIAAVCSMSRKCFYKSMTTINNHKVWQDVYHVPTTQGFAYVKITIEPDSRVVIQFKER